MTINFDNTEDISLNQILTTITEIEIYEQYLYVSIDLKKKVICPFHQDKSPSMGFYENKNKLKFKCFSCGAGGSVTDFVQNLFQLDFYASLRKISNDFNIRNNNTIYTNAVQSKQQELVYKKPETNIIPILKPFNAIDAEYWNSYHIELPMLLEYNISACQRVIVVKENKPTISMEYSKDNPIYCYDINKKYKIYRPLDKTGYKWLNTTSKNDIQGMNQLPESGDLLFMTSSMKDLLVLKLLGYSAIALESEAAKINPRIFDYLKACFKNIIIFYDNDAPGIKYGKTTSEDLDIPYLYLPEGEYKDISDYAKGRGLNKSSELITELIDTSNKNK